MGLLLHPPDFRQTAYLHAIPFGLEYHEGLANPMGSIRSPTLPQGSMSSGQGSSIQMRPTWEGFVSDTRDALILFEAVFQGKIPRVSRRPHDRERNNLIKSGSIFIYDETASGIKRWTDGVNWSPSRILGNFLIYRELEKPFPPGEKKRAAKKLKRPSGSDEALESPIEPPTPTSATAQPGSSSDKDLDRSLVGSLQDSYTFKEGGLIKKTMSVSLEGAHYHLVSYYNPEDVKLQTLHRPIDHDLRYIQPRPDLIHRQNFRAPVENFDAGPMSHGGRGMPGAAYLPQSAGAFMPQSSYMAQQQQSISPNSYPMAAMPHHQPHYGAYADPGNARVMSPMTPQSQQQQQQQHQQQQQQQQQVHAGYYTNTSMAPAPLGPYSHQYQTHSPYDRPYQEQRPGDEYKMEYKNYPQQHWPGQS